MAEQSTAVEAFWQEFATANQIEAPYDAWAFGGDETPELATELAQLVLDGPKRATTGLLDSFDDEEPFPTVGGYSVILDGDGEPVCIILTTQVDIVRFRDVDEEFAWTEGEGDRSLEYWRKAHTWFFEMEGSLVSDDDLVVLERFDLVWPQLS